MLAFLAGAVLATHPVVFEGMCDASGAVPLDASRVVVADDEDNVLRIYDADKGGPPLHSVRLEGLVPTDEKKRKKRVESDLEGATTFRDMTLWIASHGRNSSGKLKDDRYVLFAIRPPQIGKPAELVGKPYRRLLEDLISSESLRPFDLLEAARLAPKALGGLNVEGLTTTLDGKSVLIGFRNPIPDGKALIVPLLNPEGVMSGERAKLGEVTLLDLGGLGIRSLSSWRGRYLIAAGEYADGRRKMLYTWNGKDAPSPIPNATPDDFNPEAFFTPEDRDRIMLLSDDGTREIDGVPCKKLKDPRRRQFRGHWIAMPK